MNIVQDSFPPCFLCNIEEQSQIDICIQENPNPSLLDPGLRQGDCPLCVVMLVNTSIQGVRDPCHLDPGLCRDDNPMNVVMLVKPALADFKPGTSIQGGGSPGSRMPLPAE